MNKNTPKLSIIIPMYNTEKYIRKCINSVINQSFKSWEIIIVDDCTKGNGYEIVKSYMEKDKRIKCIRHTENKGLFQARLSGSEVATGEYIAFLDSDDYVSVDFYRRLVEKADVEKSDITIGNTVLDYCNGRRIIYNIFDTCFRTINNGKKCIDNYFEQEGLCFSWHTIWNKIYSKRIWDLAKESYKKINKKLIMTEDFAFSSVLFYYAKKICKVEGDAIFYCKHENNSTSVEGIKYDTFCRNLDDLNTAFDFVEDFLKEKNIYNQFKDKFIKWKVLYKNQQQRYLENTKYTKEEKKNIKKRIMEFCNVDTELSCAEDYFSSIETTWDNRFEKIKRQILRSDIEFVSFDIFDTLIQRPFFRPDDLFYLLDNYYRKIANINTGVDFSIMRREAEIIERRKINDKIQDITLDEIYNCLSEIYGVDNKLLDRIKEKEIELEKKYCTRRKSGYELYDLALKCNKKVIMVSDMYLDSQTIRTILEKNGYKTMHSIFISSDYRKTKVNGDLYKVAIEKMNTTANRILHIGDNYISDVKSAKRMGLSAIQLKKSIEAFENNGLLDLFNKDLPDWQDNRSAIQFFGIRTMVAVVANRYFDNPYRSFNKYTVFNADPELIGYYALGMHLYGVVDWLINNVKEYGYEDVVFMARDGWLVQQAYDRFCKVHTDIPKSKYLYISRKSMLLASIKNEQDLYKISDVITLGNTAPRKCLKYIKDSLKDGINIEKLAIDNEIDLDRKFENMEEYIKFISFVRKELWDKEKNKKNRDSIRKYFEGFFGKKSCTFDVGYSARGELYISDLLGINLDTYFININCDEAKKYSDRGKFRLKTFFDYKPTFTGCVRELLLSSIGPSCVKYDTSYDVAKPVFEEKEYKYPEKLILSEVQKESIKFIEDIIEIFGDNLNELKYQRYYISIPHESFIESPTEKDCKLLSCILFEDDLRENEYIDVAEFVGRQMQYQNQHNIKDLFAFYANSRNGYVTVRESAEKLKWRLDKTQEYYDNLVDGFWRKNNEYIDEVNHLKNFIEKNECIDIRDRNKIIKIIYYFMFDKAAIKKKIKEKIKRKNK